MSNTVGQATTIVVIPCAAAKADTATAARDLYASANFAHMLRCAEAEAADNERVMGTATRVMILSAEHGLLELDTIVAPYDTKMGDAGCVDATTVRGDLIRINPTAIVSMLPAAYANVLRAAVEVGNDNGSLDIDLMDAYENAPGIGFQRGVASSLARTCNLYANA